MTNKIALLALALGKELTQREWKLTTAESCTGGGLSYCITSVPGSSGWFERGFVTYSNTAKEEMLGVKATTLAAYGSVSVQTVCDMAEGALRKSQAQVSIAITGIAGPDGGSLEKPVGTVWFAIASIHQATQSFVEVFTGDRQSIRKQAIFTALEQTLAFINQ